MDQRLAPSPVFVPPAKGFGDRYWRHAECLPSALSDQRPGRVDEPAYRDLAENLPTLCWLADPDGYITWYNRRWHDYCGSTPEQMEGWGWQSVHDPAVLPDVLAGWTGAIASGEAFEMVFPLRGADGTFRPFLTRIIPLRDKAGAIRAWIGNNVDVSAQVAAEEELRRSREELEEAHRRLAERETFMSSVLAASTDCIKVIELDGTLSFMSEGGMGVMEVSDFNSVRGCPWPDLLAADGPDHARAAIEAAKQGRTTHFEAPADTLAGNPKHWSISVSPIPGPDGRVERILSVSRDHTELHRAQEQQKLLNDELAHRIKNLLSVVHAIAFQTLAKIADKDAVKAFEDRLAALARSQDALTGHGVSTAMVGDLARAAVAVFGVDRFHFAGPEVTIGQRTALALSLMFHELATNAVKYGALSVPDGNVRVTWAIRSGEGEPCLDLNWAELGGPPVTEPTRIGFGSRVIRMGLTGSGGVDVQYGPQGLTVAASAPLYQVQEA